VSANTTAISTLQGLVSANITSISTINASLSDITQLIVAPFDAVAPLAANFKCDGIDDAATIREALHTVLGLGDGGETFGWTHLSSAPVIPLEFPFVFFDGTTYHAFGGYGTGGSQYIGHATSSDGITYALDTVHNPILSKGTAGQFDDTSILVSNAWLEGGTWYMLYGGNGAAVGLATASVPEGPWTKYVSNPVIAAGNEARDPAGIMKVGSTYYLYTNNVGGDRQVDIWTSTDLHAWTRQTPYPVFRGARYCSCPFKYNSKYYLIVAHYYEGRRGSMLELWEDTAPTFKEGSRKFLGIVVYGRTWESVDTPSLITSTIERDTFPNNEFLCYYAKTDSRISGIYHPGFIVKENTVAAAIAKAVMPRTGKVKLLEGTIVLTDETAADAYIDIAYGNILECNRTTIKLADAFNDTSARGIIFVENDSTLKGVILDGNTDNVTSLVRFLHVSNSGLADEIEIKNCDTTPVIYGELRNGKIYRNSCITTITESGVLRNCKAYGNSGTSAIILQGTAKAYDCETWNNLTGIDARETSILEKCHIHHNSSYGLVLTNGAIAKECVVSDNKVSSTTVGVSATLAAKLVNCVIRNNYKNVKIESGATGVKIKGGEISGASKWGIEGNGVFSADGVNLFKNIGYSNNGQIYLGAKSRVTNCIMEATTTTQKNQIQVAEVATGSVIGGNQLKSGSVGYIEKLGAATTVEYNNEEIP
jgi:hypothetical protein